MSNTAMQSSESVEWYTPSLYVETVRALLGTIDLDPASCEQANKVVQATRYYTKEQNGLMKIHKNDGYKLALQANLCYTEWVKIWLPSSAANTLGRAKLLRSFAMDSLPHYAQNDNSSFRTCTQCNIEQPLNTHHFDRCSKSGLRKVCRTCRKNAAKKRGCNLSLVCCVCSTSFERTYKCNAKIPQMFYCSTACQKTRKIDASYHPDIIKAYQSGKSSYEVAEQYSVSHTTIIKILKRCNVPILNATDYIKLGLRSHPTKGIGHTEAAKEKIRAANQKQFSLQEARNNHAHLQRRAIADGKFNVISKVEQTVAKELDTLGIAYKQQYPVRDTATGRFCACVDFMLDSGVALEVNGTYWHADPRFYPDGPIHASQKRSVAGDLKKYAALKALNIPLAIIWEHDVDIDLSLAIRDALASIEVKHE